MDQSLPPEDDVPTGPLIDAGAGLAHRLIVSLRGELARAAGAAFSLAFLRHLFRHYLRPAEAALRRAIYLIADTLPPLTARTPAKPAHPRAGGGLASQNAAPRAPAFRLTEPQPRPPADHLPLSQRPRVSILGLAPPAPPPRRAPDPVALEDRLHRRLAALDAAFRDPLRAARRLLRRLARWTRGPALSYARIPGFTARLLDASDRALLADMNTEILASFARGVDTS